MPPRESGKYMGGISFEARSKAWPKISSDCPMCTSRGLTEIPVNEFNDGDRIIEYSCGTRVTSYEGSEWSPLYQTQKCKNERSKFDA